MRIVLFLISISVLIFNAYPANSNILFYDDCENQPSQSDWRTIGNGEQGKSFSVSSEQAKAGNHSYKYVLPNLPPSSDGHIGTVLLKPVKHFDFNKEYWIGFSIYIPADFDFPSEKGNWVLGPQFHDQPDNVGSCDNWRNPMVAMYADDATNGLKVYIIAQQAQCPIKTYGDARTYDRSASYPSPPVNKGAWNDVVLNFKFNYSTGGILNVWLNGAQIAADTGRNCYNDNNGPYFYIGLYGPVDKATKVYYDEIRVGDSNSSYNEVAPKGSGSGGGNTNTLEPPYLKVIPE